MTNFHPLEVVGRGSETQLQVGDLQTIQFEGKMNITIARLEFVLN